MLTSGRTTLNRRMEGKGEVNQMCMCMAGHKQGTYSTENFNVLQIISADKEQECMGDSTIVGQQTVGVD